MKARSRKLIAWVLVLVLISADICAIAEGFASLILPEAVKIIEEEAFYGDMSIEKVVVPEGATEIGSKAFADSSLREIDLPDTLTTIANDSFEGCADLTVTAPKDSYAYVWAKYKGYIEELQESPAEDFRYSIKDGQATIKEYIGSDTQVVIPSMIDNCPVTSVGIGAFNICRNLTSIIFPDTITFIDWYAFYGCSGLSNIDLPNAITSIGDYTFCGCSSLTSIDIPDGVTSIGDGAFHSCSSLTSIDIPDGVTSIGDGAFYGCSSLTSIYIPDGVTTIADNTFKNCTNLKSIYGKADSFAETFANNNGYEFVEGTIPDTTAVPELDMSSATLDKATYAPGETIIISGIQVKNADYVVFSDNGGHLTTKNISVTNTSSYQTLEAVEMSIDQYAADGDYFVSVQAFDSEGNSSEDDQTTLKFTVRYELEETPSSAFYYTTEVTLGGKHVTIHGYNGIDNEIVVPRMINNHPVTSISEEAFAWCSNLTSVVLPDTVTSIGSRAFYNCSSLVRIDLSDSVTSIESHAFENCSSLINVDIPDGVTSIESYAFANCSNLINVDIPDGVTSIGSYAFTRCSNLINVDIPDGVTYIWEYAFSKCTGLTSIVLPNSLVEIEQGVFYSCISLTNICFSNEITIIGNYAFANCYSLTNINIPDGVTIIGSGAFTDCDNLTSICLPDSVVSLGKEAFRGCTNLIHIDLPKDITIIEQSTFAGCISLTSIDIPNNVTSIGKWAFSGCSSLTSIALPDSITSIEGSAFSQCSSLINLDLPDSITSIGTGAFSQCSSLINLDLPDSITSIGSGAFSECSNLINIDLPEGITSIEFNTFDNCTSLISVDIPDSVTSIGDCAFEGCSGLTSIDLSNTLISIGNSAFRYCSSLTNIDFPNSITSIGENAFYDCQSLSGNVVIPDGVTRINKGLFDYCERLTGLVIPRGVSSIARTFYGCDNLTIYVPFNSFAEDWVKEKWDGEYKVYTRESQYYGNKEYTVPDMEAIQETWVVIDEYKNSEYHLFDAYLDFGEEFVTYLFEAFVLEYQDDLGLQASVATSEIVNAIKNGVSDTAALIFCDLDADSLWAMLDDDKQVAQVIVDYLTTAAVGTPNVAPMKGTLTSDEGVFLRKWTAELFNQELDYLEGWQDKWDELVSWALNVDTHAAVLSTEEVEIASIVKNLKFTGYSDENLAKIISEMVFIEKSTGIEFAFGDMLDINSGNARSISKKISKLARDTNAGKSVTFSVDADWGTNVKWSFRTEVAKALNLDGGKTIYEEIEDMRDEVEEKIEDLEAELPENAAKWENVFKGISVSKWMFDAMLEGMNAYEQVAKYEAILTTYEKELRSILRNTDCKNIDAVVGKVLSILRQGIANSIAYAMKEGAEKLLGDLADDVVSETFDNLLEAAFPKANIYTLVFDFGTDVAMLLCDASNTKLKVWGVEDLYDDFQSVKQDLIDAMDLFYYEPVLDNFNKLYYTAKYYALLVRSGSNQVSIILRSDAESFVGWVQSFFDKYSVEDRIEDAKEVPIRDDLTLIRFVDMLFPTVEPI